MGLLAPSPFASLQYKICGLFCGNTSGPIHMISSDKLPNTKFIERDSVDIMALALYGQFAYTTPYAAVAVIPWSCELVLSPNM